MKSILEFSYLGSMQNAVDLWYARDADRHFATSALIFSIFDVRATLHIRTVYQIKRLIRALLIRSVTSTCTVVSMCIFIKRAISITIGPNDES